MTNKQAFDTMKEHLLSMEKQSREDVTDASNFNCMYRDPDGNRCPVGKLIPDAEYEEGFENAPLDDLIGVCKALSGLHESMLRACQAIHDDELNWNEDGLNGHGRRKVESTERQFAHLWE